ncbi:MAG: YceI family protein [Cyanobacteria bacterium NC_groundwater_1444_Ag_S-0.65um_54_12]|nr:YceI family protein [Cyanobacteria bacterium NC_groundwater_1444_Ag_S-0.65um_54_12]
MISKQHFVSLTLIAISTMVLPLSAEARVWKMTQDMHSTTEASFVSKASIVKFAGRTSKVEGTGEINVDKPSRNPKGDIVVDLLSLDTGIALRNDHMRGMIEAVKYPTASFKLKQLNAPKLVAQQPISGTAMGDFTLHGMTHAITVPVTLTFLPEQDKNYRPGDWVAVSTEFKVKLSDYGIALPQPILGIKIADELNITLDGMAKAVEQ